MSTHDDRSITMYIKCILRPTVVQEQSDLIIMGVRSRTPLEMTLL